MSEAAPAQTSTRQPGFWARQAARHPALEVLLKVLRIPQASFGVVIIALTLFAALFAPLIVPFDPEEIISTIYFLASAASICWGRIKWAATR